MLMLCMLWGAFRHAPNQIDERIVAGIGRRQAEHLIGVEACRAINERAVELLDGAAALGNACRQVGGA
jgi:hypothetical protein